jgi:hypothetical protein
MIRLPLKGDRITELSLKLAMLSSQRSIGLADIQFREIEGALRWHRWSCRAIPLARRLLQALLSRRFTKCMALVAEQKAMLHSAADESSDDEPVLRALVALSSAVVHYELGPCPTPKQRLAFAACEIPSARARFAHLVREGEIESTPEGLRLLHAARRRVAAYIMLAAFVSWPGLLFAEMALDGRLSPEGLVGYLIGAVLVSVWLTRGLFTELRADELVIHQLNSRLKPRQAAGKQLRK